MGKIQKHYTYLQETKLVMSVNLNSCEIMDTLSKDVQHTWRNQRWIVLIPNHYELCLPFSRQEFYYKHFGLTRTYSAIFCQLGWIK